MEQVSWSPRAFLYKKLLSEEECDHLINHVRRSLNPPFAAMLCQRRAAGTLTLAAWHVALSLRACGQPINTVSRCRTAGRLYLR